MYFETQRDIMQYFLLFSFTVISSGISSDKVNGSQIPISFITKEIIKPLCIDTGKCDLLFLQILQSFIHNDGIVKQNHKIYIVLHRLRFDHLIYFWLGQFLQPSPFYYKNQQSHLFSWKDIRLSARKLQTFVFKNDQDAYKIPLEVKYCPYKKENEGYPGQLSCTTCCESVRS